MDELLTVLRESRALRASQVLPWLYLSSAREAKDKDYLSSLGISHIMNVADDVPNYLELTRCFKYINLHVADFGADKGISRVFPEAISVAEDIKRRYGEASGTQYPTSKPKSGSLMERVASHCKASLTKIKNTVSRSESARTSPELSKTRNTEQSPYNSRNLAAEGDPMHNGEEGEEVPARGPLQVSSSNCCRSQSSLPPKTETVQPGCRDGDAAFDDADVDTSSREDDDKDDKGLVNCSKKSGGVSLQGDSLDASDPGGAVPRLLVHCAAGQNRSVSVVIAILMVVESMTLRDAYAHVRACRPRVCPFQDNRRELVSFEKSLRGGEATMSVDDFHKEHNIRLIANRSATATTHIPANRGKS